MSDFTFDCICGAHLETTLVAEVLTFGKAHADCSETGGES